jgi:hypothetical protein
MLARRLREINWHQLLESQNSAGEDGHSLLRMKSN